MRKHDRVDDAMYRVGASVLGMLAGSITSLLIFVPTVVTGLLATPLERLIFAGAVSGALCGAVIPSVAVRAFEGVIHFFAGAMAVLLGADVPETDGAPGWLAAAALTGALYCGGIWLALAALSS